MNVALRSQSLNLLSLCTGGAGLDLGIELAIPSARAVCMVEREAFAVAHLVSAMEQGLLAPAAIWSDAATFDGRCWRGCVDGLIGGIPCQPWSLAGKRLGSEDERDLWSHARRILVQSGAWFVLIENVGGMLSGGGGERVWRDLGRLGFAREIGLFTASEVGARHERERVFILGVADASDPRPQGRKFSQPHTTPTGITAEGVKRQVGLENQARWWATPRAKEDSQRQYANRQQTKQTLTLTCQAFSLPALASLKRGDPSSKERRSLNPLFVEWLMGWPPGWTSLVWIDCACSATELSRFKRHMRSALLQLDLPTEAPPAQLTLFG